jgi:hypothetical protein
MAMRKVNRKFHPEPVILILPPLLETCFKVLFYISIILYFQTFKIMIAASTILLEALQ